MQEPWDAVKKSVAFAKKINISAPCSQMTELGSDLWSKCKGRQLEAEADNQEEDISDERLSHLAKFTDHLPLSLFEGYFELVPQLVNVVTLCEALPHPKSVGGGKLPLDLQLIAARCSNSFFAPRRFAAVQLAFSNPRSRVLVFHTGRIVGTGCDSAMAARLAVARAQRQIAMEAGVYLRLRNFSVINQVAAASLGARLDCDKFADAHSSDSHFDRASFVGLAWRPQGEVICCEIYSTGRANLPGSTRNFDLLLSWSRMVAELYRYSDHPERMALFPKELRDYHKTRSKHKRRRPDAASADAASLAEAQRPRPATSIAEMWGGDEEEIARTAQSEQEAAPMFGAVDDDVALLEAAGF